MAAIRCDACGRIYDSNNDVGGYCQKCGRCFCGVCWETKELDFGETVCTDCEPLEEVA